MQYKSLLVVIPTRNRADLAVNAVNSVLSQANCRIELIVSDNSTEKQEVEKLADFCADLDDGRMHYIRPPKPLPMTEHWDWAMRQALEISDFSHVVYLTDRMLFLKNSLHNLQKVLTEYPDKIVAYSYGSIDDSKMPISVNQGLWTGKLFEISSLNTLKQYAESNIINSHGLPKMLNSVAPRDHITAMLKRYGNVFSSISPDYNFAFRSLSMVESTLYYDRSLIVHYGMSRSNGGNFIKGNFNKDVKDFINNMSSVDVDLGFDSPINLFCVLPNCIIYEYQNAKRENKQLNFPEVNQNKYLQSLINNVFSFGNEEMREDMIKKSVPNWEAA